MKKTLETERLSGAMLFALVELASDVNEHIDDIALLEDISPEEVRLYADISDPELSEDGPLRWLEAKVQVPEDRFGVDYSQTFQVLVRSEG